MKDIHVNRRGCRPVPRGMSGFRLATVEALPAAPIQNISGARHKKDRKRHRHETEGT
jgi:hypothetical protein